MTLCSNLGCLGTGLELHCQIAVISNNTLRPYQNPSLRQKTDSSSAKSFFVKGTAFVPFASVLSFVEEDEKK